MDAPKSFGIRASDERYACQVLIRHARDQGGEWIEASQGGFQKRIDFEAGADVPEVRPVLEQVRKLRAKVSAEHGRKAAAD